MYSLPQGNEGLCSFFPLKKTNLFPKTQQNFKHSFLKKKKSKIQFGPKISSSTFPKPIK